ncbi:hypothetical protein HER10_EVM0011213 [Colletotrichum scovillei]|uniref:uncharacterized protein n=1 Tax=Colletotrichum scovillei TaxID=1209932 RepID=UPI0015C2EAA4|nr:uncharacterized protein HER10_EVM0011213 [Colletotrichum scovillei]KAF4772750.1 hypothetical protein HER10_EVM0011213 [Colletotrichum scovillei]KAG7038455.1 FtsJ-like methyltransferase family protein [Colletotrichum scovillei]
MSTDCEEVRSWERFPNSSCCLFAMASSVGRPGPLSSGVDNNPKPSDFIIPYLMNHAPAFKKLYEVQQRVWESSKADQHFQNQRSRADHANKKVARSFFNMMREIAEELHAATNAFSVTSLGTQQPRILDMCAAPGGFLETALEMCPEARVLAFTLPLADGGHRVLLKRDSRVKFKFLDITMLAEDMNMGVIPANNEQSGKFLPRKIAPHLLFRLVLCDG